MNDAGWILPDLVIKEALEAGLATVRSAFANGTAEDFFKRVFANLDDVERTKAIEWLSTHDVPIRFNWPRVEQEFPCWVIRLYGGDNATYIGDSGYQASFIGGDTEGIVSAERWQSGIGVETWTENTGVLLWCHHLSLFLLASQRWDLADHFPHSQKLSSRDLDPVQLGGEGGHLVFRRGVQIMAGFDQFDAERMDALDEFDLGVTSDVEAVEGEAFGGSAG